MSPYSTKAQKAATTRKLSHGSPLDHVNSPKVLLRGRRKGCENARALVTSGGVAMSKGDFMFTCIVADCRVLGEVCELLGENEAIVGGFGSLLELRFGDALLELD